MVVIDVIVVKICDGQVTNRPFYAAIGVTVDGQRDISGLWIGSGGQGAKYLLSVFARTSGAPATPVGGCCGRAR